MGIGLLLLVFHKIFSFSSLSITKLILSIIGYDLERFYFMDPSTLANYTYIPVQEFEDRWHGNNILFLLYLLFLFNLF